MNIFVLVIAGIISLFFYCLIGAMVALLEDKIYCSPLEFNKNLKTIKQKGWWVDTDGWHFAIMLIWPLWLLSLVLLRCPHKVINIVLKYFAAALDKETS